MNKKHLQILISGLIAAGALGLLINRLCQMYLENTKAQIEKESVAQFRQQLVLNDLRRLNEKVQGLEFKIIAVEAKIPPQEGTAEAARDKGFEYFKNQDFDRAIIEFKKAIQLDPQMSNAYENLGNAYYYKNDFAQAIENYNKPLSLIPRILPYMVFV